jgi:hypothetical protein
VDTRLTILGEATTRFFEEAVVAADCEASEAVILIDVEGAEFSVLNEVVLQQLSEASLIVEIHDFDDASSVAGDELISRLGRYFSIRVISQSERNPNSFDELAKWSDDDRWLLCSESRRYRMRWLVCEPLYS